MHNALKSSSQRILVTVFLSLLLSGCGISAATPRAAVGVLSGLPADNSAINQASLALEQKTGYDLALKGASAVSVPKNIDENAPSSDIQRNIRAQVEDPQTPIIAMLGASSNLATSQTAGLVNFFNLPMLVPTANGDDLFPSTNLWAFRLSAPGKAYANYLFGSVLTKANAGSEAQAQNEFPGLRIAILYEQNTFGEGAAVAAAEAAMAQSIKIGLYANFPEHSLDPDTTSKLMDGVKTENVQLVFVISSNPTVAKTLVQALHASFNPADMPVVVGEAGGFASLDFLNSPEAQKVYVLRQQIVANNCPAEVKSIYQAQSYASIYLLDQAIKQANVQKSGLTQWFSAPKSPADQAIALREKVRDILKDTNTNLPCLGQVAFDNTGQNKLLQLEIITVNQGQTLVNQVEDFSKTLMLRLQRDGLQ